MKKLLTALAITTSAIISTQANASVVIYQNNGTKLYAIGSLSVNFEQGTSEKLDLQNYGTSVYLKAHQKLSDDILASGGIKIATSSDLTSKQLYVSKYYVGFKKTGVGIITLGRTTPNGVSVQLGDYTNAYGGNNNLNADIQGFGWRAINIISDSFSGFSFGGDYIFGDEKNKITSADYGKLRHSYGIQTFYTHNFAKDTTLNINAGYNKLKNIHPTAKTDDKLYSKAEDISDVIQLLKRNSLISDSWLGAIEFIKGKLSIGGSYGQTKYHQFHYYNNNKEQISNFKMTALLLGTNYQVTKSNNIYLQYQRNTAASSFKQNVYIIGDGYSLNNNVSTFIEAVHFDTHDTVGSYVNNYIATGLTVNF